MTENLTARWSECEDGTIQAAWTDEDIELCDREIDAKGQE